MWGSRADTLYVKAIKASGMKWHLVDEDSLETREIEVGWGTNKQITTRTYGALMCAGRKHPYMVYNQYTSRHYDTRIPLILRETVNLHASGVCTYCKNFRLKELGLKEKVMG